MSTIRVRVGNTSATITGLDAATIRAMVERATGGAVKLLEDALEPVAANARREWYGPNGVNRETGKSGDIQVVTTVDIAKAEARVSVGSTDMSTVTGLKKDGANDDRARRVMGGRDMYRVRFIHQPWTNTLRAQAVTQDEWWAWSRRGLPTLPPPTDAWWTDKTHGKGLARGKWYIKATGHEDRATVAPGTGKLLPDLVTKPAKAALKRVRPQLAAAIAQGVSRGR